MTYENPTDVVNDSYTPPEGVEELVDAILSNFTQISGSSLHALCFLVESEYYGEFDERYTDCTFKLLLDGPYSEDIQKTVERLPYTHSKTRIVGGKNYQEINVDHTNDCLDPKETIALFVEGIVEDLDQQAIHNAGQRIKRFYTDTSLTEKVSPEDFAESCGGESND